MWGAISDLVKAMPPALLPVFVIFFAFFGTWVFSHVRVDKQGKRYWYSQKYEDAKRNKKQDSVLQIVKDMTNRFESLEIKMQRLDILQAIHHAPDKVEVIINLYESYKKKHGNGYIDGVYDIWYKKYALGVLEHRV